MKKQKRSMFEKIFNPRPRKENQEFKSAQLLNSTSPDFRPFDRNAYELDLVRSSVDALARNIAKLKGRKINGKTVTDDTKPFNRILQYKPNEYMEAYSFYYKVATQYYMKNNAFIFPKYENGKLVALYPIMASQIKLLEDKKGNLYVRCIYLNGYTATLPYSEVIHLRRHFNEHDIWGTDNDCIRETLEVANTLNQSISVGAKLIASIRGILEFITSSKDEDLIKKRDKFIKNNMEINDGTGIIVTDSKSKYTPINEDNKLIPDGQLNYIKNNIYSYFGVNEKIIQSTFNENEWDSFYEGTIEPFAIQMSQAFTNALFTEREKGLGNVIVFEANRLQYASNNTKIQIVKELGSLGLLSVNEGREIFNLGPVEDGDKRLVSLNYVNSVLQDKYQLGGGNDDTSSGSGASDSTEEGGTSTN